MNEDIRISLDFWDHHKTIRLKKRLGYEGIEALTRLWFYAAKNRPNGHLINMDDEDIAIAAHWNGDTNNFISALTDPKYPWLDRNGDHYYLHNWHKRNAYAAFSEERSKKAREKAAIKWKTDLDSINKKNRSERLSYARKKGKHTKQDWEEMVNFFNNTCVKCDGSTGLNGVVKDHIIPIYQGGNDSIKNLQPLCAKCNVSKGPENKDYRLEFCDKKDLKMPAKWLPNACQMPARTPAPSPSPIPSPSPTPYSNGVEKIKFDFKKGIFLHITETDINGWQKAYPDIDIRNEILQAAQWCKRNKKKVQGRDDLGRTLVNWFSREQDKKDETEKSKNKKTNQYKLSISEAKEKYKKEIEEYKQKLTYEIRCSDDKAHKLMHEFINELRNR